MKIRDGFVLRQVADATIVVPAGDAAIDFNGMITLNETAAFLWKEAERLTIEHSVFSSDELCKALCEEYDVLPGQAMTDIENTLSAWQEAGVIE